MYYISFGSGKRPFVMIAGMSMAGIEGLGAAAEEAYRSFEEEYTVYVFDRIDPLPDGYTVRQMADDVAECMRMLNISDADVMGPSQGGMIAQYLAAEHPELVHAAVYCASCCRLNEIGMDTMKKWKSLAKQKDGRGIYRDFFERVYKKMDTDMLKEIEDTATEDQCRRFQILAQACIDFDSSKVLHKINCPVLVIGSDVDHVLSCESSVELANILGSPIYIYSGYGHAVCDEAPDFTERILTFYRSVRV